MMRFCHQLLHKVNLFNCNLPTQRTKLVNLSSKKKKNAIQLYCHSLAAEAATASNS